MWRDLDGLAGILSKYQRSRKQNIARYGQIYAPFKPPGHWRDSSCVYCGNIANERDHIPPLSWIAALGQEYFESRRLMTVWVPACKECNASLGSKKLFTIKERTVFLLGYYLKKYEKLMRAEVWEDYEIDRLNGRLKQTIERFSILQIALDRRIAILEENVQVRQ